ncbi:hypothetical protein BDV98DRAFT_635181 [Pterulicium gracile]|uniref:Uncharacterized protein n=1 Tax=Pterulicium gracile TaxID=1884261 RepID=A0A5C3Q6M2_9AGAR|nr:hypothetical protein BDV98DRAFT_635181 [Pterula gracilis]
MSPGWIDQRGMEFVLWGFHQMRTLVHLCHGLVRLLMAVIGAIQEFSDEILQLKDASRLEQEQEDCVDEVRLISPHVFADFSILWPPWRSSFGKGITQSLVAGAQLFQVSIGGVFEHLLEICLSLLTRCDESVKEGTKSKSQISRVSRLQPKTHGTCTA